MHAPVAAPGSVPSTRSVTVPAGSARPVIRHALRHGGECTVEVDGRIRTLAYDPRLDRPTNPLPWPLRVFQPTTVRYIVHEGGTLVSGHLFIRSDVQRAMDYFLRDITSETPIHVMRH